MIKPSLYKGYKINISIIEDSYERMYIDYDYWPLTISGGRSSPLRLNEFRIDKNKIDKTTQTEIMVKIDQALIEAQKEIDFEILRKSQAGNKPGSV